MTQDKLTVNMPVVIACITFCNIKKLNSCQTMHLYVFIKLTKTAVISLYSIKGIVYIIDAKCLLCETGTGFYIQFRKTPVI